MAQILIRRLDENLKDVLRRRASQHGVSMEEEARSILRRELLKDKEGTRRSGMGSRIAAIFSDIPDNDSPLPTVPDEPARPFPTTYDDRP